MEVVVLASGSSGNALLVSSGETSVLIDAGVSALQIRRRLELVEKSPKNLAAVLLTHEHSDHVRGLEVLLKRCPTAVWATAGTSSRLATRCLLGGEIESGRELRIGNLRVLPVATSHDAAEPVAFRIEDDATRIGVCTDTGTFTALLERRMTGCSALFVETNHDADLLRHGPYPWPLKQRIASRLGHLGNHQTEEALVRLDAQHRLVIVGLHVSEHNNTPALATAALRRAAGEIPQVAVVSRHEMLKVSLGARAATLHLSPLPAARTCQPAVKG